MATRLLATVAALGVAVVAASPAQAVTVVNGGTYDLPLTLTSGGGNSYFGGSTDAFTTSGSALKNFTVNYSFTAPADGFGSISFTTTSAAPNNALLSILSATFEGQPVNFTTTTLANGAVTYDGTFDFSDAEFAQPFTLTINAQLRRSGQLSTTVSYAAAVVPEPASWAMMIGGFGLAGGALRRRRTSTTVRFA